MDEYIKEEVIKAIIGILIILAIGVFAILSVTQYEDNKKQRAAQAEEKRLLKAQEEQSKRDKDFKEWKKEKEVEKLYQERTRQRIIQQLANNEIERIGEFEIKPTTKFVILIEAKGIARRQGNKLILEFKDIKFKADSEKKLLSWNVGITKFEEGRVWRINKRGQENRLNQTLNKGESIRIKNHFTEINLTNEQVINLENYWLTIEVNLDNETEEGNKFISKVYSHSPKLKNK